MDEMNLTADIAPEMGLSAQEYAEIGMQGVSLKGDKGDKGDAGYSPVKGVDYWTEADKEEIVSEVEADVAEDLNGKVDKESGKGLSDAASVSVYHANAGNEVLQIVGQDGVTKLTAFYGKQAVDDQMSAFLLGLSGKVDKDTTGRYGLSDAKNVALSDSISTPSQLKVTEQGGSEFWVNFYSSELMDKLLAKLKEQSVPHTTASDYPVTLTDALAGESLRGLKVYGGCGKNLYNGNSNFNAVRQGYAPYIARENNAVIVSANGSGTVRMGAWIIPMGGKTKVTISADNIAFEGTPTILIREADSFPQYITTISTFGSAVDTITAQEGFSKTVNVSSAYIAIVMQVVNDQKVTFDHLQVEEGSTATAWKEYKEVGDADGGVYKIPLRVCGKNLFDSEQLLKASGWTCTDGVYSGTVSELYRTFGINTSGYNIPLRGEKLAISFEAKNAAKTTGTTYFQIYYTGGAKQNIGAINSTEWKKYSGVTNAGNISKIVAGYSNDDTVYFRNIQIEAASAVTGYEPYSGSSAVAEVDTPLASGEYIDLLGKKRYAADGTATDITVEGDLKTIESERLTIDCTTGVQPPRIEAEYWQDINKVVGNLTSAILANGGNA